MNLFIKACEKPMPYPIIWIGITNKRNGKIHSKFNNKTEEYSCYEEGHLISNDAFCHSGLDKRLFQKKSELNWRRR